MKKLLFYFVSFQAVFLISIQLMAQTPSNQPQPAVNAVAPPPTMPPMPQPPGMGPGHGGGHGKMMGFGGGRGAGNGPCAKFHETLCKDVKPGGGHIMKCLADNKDKITDPMCKRHVEMVATKFQACQSDIDSLCGNVEVGPRGGGIIPCLKSNEAKLSQACKDSLATLNEQRGKWGKN